LPNSAKIAGSRKSVKFLDETNPGEFGEVLTGQEKSLRLNIAGQESMLKLQKVLVTNVVRNLRQPTTREIRLLLTLSESLASLVRGSIL
jgi:hypothetical protein